MNKKPVLAGFLLTLILLLALGLRLFRLNTTPPGVLVDGAALGYNAYSILKTGTDEWGVKYPLTIKSFGDYKAAGYVYLALPFISLFGLSPFSIRLPSVTSGIVSLIAIYFITKSITKHASTALLVIFLAAISPWHIYLSRMSWEVHAAAAWMLTGVAIFLRAQTRTWLWILSAVCFCASMYTYAGYRIFTPLVVLSLLFYFYKSQKIYTGKLVKFILVCVIFSLPIISETLFRGAGSRLGQVVSFTNDSAVYQINEKREFCGLNNNQLLPFCYAAWNKPTMFILHTLQNYLGNFSPDFLFIRGDEGKFINNPQYGGIFVWISLFWVIGLYITLKNLHQPLYKWLLVWTLLSPVISLFGMSPSFIRSSPVFYPVIITCGIGVQSCILYLFKKKHWWGYTATVVFVIISFASLGMVMLDYFLVFTKQTEAWEEQYNQVFTYLKGVESSYDTIVVRKMHQNPYIYAAFYTAMDPVYFQHTIKRIGTEVLSIGKYQFFDGDLTKAYCNWQTAGKPKTAYVTNELVSEAEEPLLTVFSFNKVHRLAYIYDFSSVEASIQEQKLIPIKCDNQVSPI